MTDADTSAEAGKQRRRQMTDTDKDAVEAFIQDVLKDHILSEGMTRNEEDTADAYKIVELLRALLDAKEGADAERDEAYALGYHDCQQKGITEGRLVLIDGPELLAAKAEAAALRKKLEAAVDGLTDIASKVSWEINPSNYDHVEVCDMNSDWCEIGDIADATLATLDQPKEG